MNKILLILVFSAISFVAYSQDKYLIEGNNYLSAGDLEKAEKTFRKGIKSNPNNLIYQCQLGLTLVQQEKHVEAQQVLEKILLTDSNHVAAIWYSGINNFKAKDDREAISYFEKALTLLDKNSGQYYSANWFIGKSYSILLRNEGLTFKETDRMLECYEEYLRLQPDAKDSQEIREYVERKKKRRPSSNVEKWRDM